MAAGQAGLPGRVSQHLGAEEGSDTLDSQARRHRKVQGDTSGGTRQDWRHLELLPGAVSRGLWSDPRVCLDSPFETKAPGVK